VERPPPAKEPPAAARRPPPERQPFVALEAGVELLARQLGYVVPGGGTTPLGLQWYSMLSPAFRLELYPLSPLGDGLFDGLGLMADYAFSVGLKTEGNPTNSSLLQAGLLWRFYPVEGWRFAVIPEVSYQWQTSEVDPPISGLPNSNLHGIEGAVGFEFPLGSVVTILARGGFVYWLSAKDLLETTAFFPGGDAWALDGNVGLSLRIAGPISVRLMGEYRYIRYAFDPGTSFGATGAVDQYVGGRAMLRVEL
jgi:hypothetical protein